MLAARSSCFVVILNEVLSITAQEWFKLCNVPWDMGFLNEVLSITAQEFRY